MRHFLHSVLLESEPDNCSALLRLFDAVPVSPPKRDEAWGQKRAYSGRNLRAEPGAESHSAQLCVPKLLTQQRFLHIQKSRGSEGTRGIFSSLSPAFVAEQQGSK